MGSEQNRFPLQEWWKKWTRCSIRVPCFGSQRGGKRIVPAARTPVGNVSTNHSNGGQTVGLANQATSHLLAPPSSPASFTNSAFPSTAQSPACFPSLSSSNSPVGPASTMYATGPYAHETQLVSPPVFSTFTTEPSTAPFTPPPELAHITTPSSPDVPYAQFLSSTLNLKCAGKTCISKSDLQATYPYSPESPPSSQLSGPLTTTSMPRDSNFFCPETFAQFYFDQPSHSGGRLSISKDSDIYSNGASTHHSRQNKTAKQDAEEIEAYRASFGFSADEMITTAQYMEISDALDISGKLHTEVSKLADEWKHGQQDVFDLKTNSQTYMGTEVRIPASGFAGRDTAYASACDNKIQTRGEHVNRERTRCNHALINEEDIFSNMCSSGARRKHDLGLSYSDAEVDYRRGRSLREGRGDFIAHA